MERVQETYRLNATDIVGYLPHKLQTNYGTLSLINMDYVGHQFETKCWDGNTQSFNELEKLIPYLRPFHELSKEIEYDGEKFTPIEKLLPKYFKRRKCDESYKIERKDDTIYVYRYSSSLNTWSCEITLDITFTVINLFYKWHIDFQYLIDKGLAKDLNNIKNI